MKKKVASTISLVVLILILLYVSGIVAQFMINIKAWEAAGSDYRTSPALPSFSLGAVGAALTHFRKAPSPFSLFQLASQSCACSDCALGAAEEVPQTAIGT